MVWIMIVLRESEKARKRERKENAPPSCLRAFMPSRHHPYITTFYH